MSSAKTRISTSRQSNIAARGKSSKAGKQQGKQIVRQLNVVNSVEPEEAVLAASAAQHEFFRLTESMDKATHAALAQLSSGLSLSVLSDAMEDWAMHLASSPGKRLELLQKSLKKSRKLAEHISACALPPYQSQPCIEPLPQDRRFKDAKWQQWPYSLYYQSFLLNQQWWHNATTDIRGMTKQHENVLSFATRQILDMFSPSNNLFLNPVVFDKTVKSGGQNLVAGWKNMLEDFQAFNTGVPRTDDSVFGVGENLATTPGKVIYRNRLIELIQYEPTTDKVRPEPILIVPAWIMKYYILDLSEHNSLVRYLTSQGFTVFMVSWKNPDIDDRDLGMDDYRQLGVMAALDTIDQVCGGEKVHAVGYCLGGTLLSIAAATMAREGDERLQSLTLLAAQVDFTEAGELTLFINETQVSMLEDLMWKQGYLESGQMSGAFQILRSNDLIWSHMIRDYMMGERSSLNDLMAWNADGTRMPYRMHSQYLRSLYLNNDLSTGRFKVDNQVISISDIRVPMLSVGTERDHVAPWQSVYKIHQFTDTDITFVLTSGGHNAGIVSEPGHPRRHFRSATTTKDEPYRSPEKWLNNTTEQEGSWWPELTQWLHDRSGAKVSPPTIGASQLGFECLCDAPGTYVFQE